MGSRGRKSGAELTVVSAHNVVSIERARPPSDLTERQQQEWRAIVNRMPADWFPRETHGMLAQLCREIDRAENTARIIDMVEARFRETGKIDLKAYRDLRRTETQTSMAICSLSTKMRISQQSSYDKTRRKASKPQAPWEIEGGEEHSLD